MSASKLLQEYKKVVDAGAIVSKTDTKGKITYANDKFCQISGYSQDELIGKNHNIVRHPDMPSSIYKELWETIKNKQTWQGKVKNRTKDGSSYYVHVTIVPILDDDDNIVEYVALRQDITELEELNQNLENRVSQEVEKNRKKDEQSILMLSAFLENSPNAIVVYSGTKIKYANSKFLDLIEQDESETLNSEFDLNTLLDKKEDYISSLAKIDPSVNTNKISISKDNSRHIFCVSSSAIPSLDNELLQMYTLNNITMLEYQKLKIEHYSQRLEDFVKKLYKNHFSYKKEPSDKSKEHDLIIEQPSETVTVEKRALSDHEKKVLKKSRQNMQISSSEYSADIDAYILEEIDELAEIEAELSDYITQFDEKKELHSLHKLADKFIRYASTVSLLIEFEDLSFAIKSLGELLHSVKADDLDESKNKKTLLFLSTILMDLTSWRRTIFIEQSAQDIHYLDSSLFSTILQFELIFNQAKEVEDDDDFEMF